MHPIYKINPALGPRKFLSPLSSRIPSFCLTAHIPYSKGGVFGKIDKYEQNGLVTLYLQVVLLQRKNSLSGLIIETRQFIDNNPLLNPSAALNLNRYPNPLIISQ
jgi:hypothetical protein